MFRFLTITAVVCFLFIQDVQAVQSQTPTLESRSMELVEKLLSGMLRRESQYSGCGGRFTARTGVIQTPTYQGSYGHDQNCTWIITVSDDASVSLKFSSMDIEFHQSCAFDYLQIYDGVDSNSPMLTQRLCGQTPPVGAIVSSGPSMLVRFVSDETVSGGGFVAAYEEVDAKFDNTSCLPAEIIGSRFRSSYYLVEIPNSKEDVIAVVAFYEGAAKFRVYERYNKVFDELVPDYDANSAYTSGSFVIKNQTYKIKVSKITTGTPGQTDQTVDDFCMTQ